METLPAEMVEMIVQQLTPQDLARCSAVCREWHEIFNQDWVWKPLCDPKLEEPLRTIPCVAKPAFVTPETVSSTLSPISCWKLAFMRENHLWKNWTRKEMTRCKVENVINLNNRYPKNVDFLSDTLVVVWLSGSINIFDITVIPGTLVAETNVSVPLDHIDRYCKVISPTMLLVQDESSIQVFIVDIMNKFIKLKHIISLDSAYGLTFVVKEHFLFFGTNNGSNCKIFDLNTGMILKEEPHPVKVHQNESVKLFEMKSSPTSNFVAVAFLVVDLSRPTYSSHTFYHIYSLKELTFLPGPVTDRPGTEDIGKVSLHGHWVALMDKEDKTLTVYNLLTRECLLNYEVKSKFECIEQIWVCGTSFVFWGYEKEESLEIEEENEKEKSWLKIYSPLDRTLTTLYENSGRKKIEEINNKFIAIFDDDEQVSENVFKFSGQMVEKCDFSVHPESKVNRSFTIELSEEYVVEFEEDWPDPTWYVRWVW